MSSIATAVPAERNTPTAADALNLFYPAANAAYGSQDPAHLLVGNSFVFRNQIKVDPQKAAQVPPQHLPMLASMLKLSPIFGFVATRPSAVFVSFRGTETPGEWLSDFEAIPTSSQIGNGRVHEGFQKVYEVIRESALDGLRAVLNSGDQVFVTGHSLGAALAILFANDAVSLAPNLQVCTFAGPRTGLGDFVSSYNQRVPSTLRVVNRWDIVPNLPVPAPPLCLYEHVGSLLAIDGGFTFDLAHAHSLPLSYFPGLKKEASQAFAAPARAA
jgi:triacylglycerol lipase